MPLQNRVDPRGNLIFTAARGAWLGNRGILHNEQKQILRPWQHKSWVICQLQFKSRQRRVFGPNTYSELFFIDEATAFAAGHRPCGECRRERYNEFKAAWSAANGKAIVTIAEIDRQLHKERAVRGGGKVTYAARFGDLPAGSFIELDDKPYLLWNNDALAWSPEGYASDLRQPDANERVTVLTPLSIVRMFIHGFIPEVHKSATACVQSQSHAPFYRT